MKQMKSKSTLKCYSQINNSRSHTQDLKSINSVKQWVNILQGIDAIANKIKQISVHQLKNTLNTTNNTMKDKCLMNKSNLRVDTSLDFSRSKSKKKGNNKYYRQSYNNNNNRNMISKRDSCNNSRRDAKSQRKDKQYYQKTNSQRHLKKMLTCASQQQKIFRNVDNSHYITQNNQIKQKSCMTKCHQVQIQVNELKKINQNLLKKNEQLQKKLLQTQKQQNLRINSHQKVQRYRTNEIILKVIKQNQQQNIHIYNNINEKQPQTISIQLKPFEGINFQNQNQLIRLSPVKTKKQIIYPQYKKQIINNLKQKKQSSKQKQSRFQHLSSMDTTHHHNFNQSTNTNQSLSASTNLNMNVNMNKKNRQMDKLRKPSQLKSLQTQFDRLMEISYMERNKSKKRVIWDQMKTIASQLKMMRNFTQV